MAAISSTIAAIIGATALGAGAVGVAAGSQKKDKGPSLGGPPVAPRPEDADAKAKEEMLKKRRARDRSGGKTILASQYGGNTDSTTKTLLGQ